MGRKRYECCCNYRKNVTSNITGYSNGDVVCDNCGGIVYTKNKNLVGFDKHIEEEEEK